MLMVIVDRTYQAIDHLRRALHLENVRDRDELVSL